MNSLTPVFPHSATHSPTHLITRFIPPVIEPSSPASAASGAPATPLCTLLDESLAYPPEFGHGLSSHLPMALAALHALGAGPAQMRRFTASYLRRSGLAMRRAERHPPAALPDWQALRGRFDAFPVLQAHFNAVLPRSGAEAVLREAVPALMPGLAGAAFHGLIRTAHAVESGHAGELAAALAYWAARWRLLPPAGEPAPAAHGLAPWLAAVAASLQQHDSGWHSAAVSVSGRMADATLTTTYRTLAAGPRWHTTPAETLLALARSAARLYGQSGNFTVLHMATAMRAALVLLPWGAQAEPAELLVAVWRATLAARIAAAVGPVSTQAVDGQALGEGPLQGWGDVLAAARESDDDHTIKLVHAMVWLAHRAEASGDPQPDPSWLLAAQRAVRPRRA